jgi:hypothetical protein
MTPPEEKPTDRIIDQRIRNRIIETLELAASFDDQFEYQAHQVCHVPDQVILWWYDWVGDPIRPDFDPPVFSPAELEAILRYHAVMESICDQIPGRLPDLEHLVTTDYWQHLRAAAAEALAIFQLRGRFSEHHEHDS